MSKKILARVIRVAALGAVMSASAIAFAPAAHAGGNCEPGDFDCNQTGGDVCVTVVGRPPGGGYVYHDLCVSMATDWNQETPNCHDVDVNCKEATHDPRRPVTVKVTPPHHGR